MAEQRKSIEVGGVPEIIRLIEEVRRAGEPRVLSRDGEDVAVVMPLPQPKKRGRGRAKTDADYEAFRRAAGGWADVDTDTLIKNIYEDRRRNNRPPVEL